MDFESVGARGLGILLGLSIYSFPEIIARIGRHLRDKSERIDGDLESLLCKKRKKINLPDDYKINISFGSNPPNTELIGDLTYRINFSHDPTIIELNHELYHIKNKHLEKMVAIKKYFGNLGVKLAYNYFFEPKTVIHTLIDSK